MKLPSTLVICGRPYSVVEAPIHEIGNGDGCIGYVDPLTETITIYDKAQPMRQLEVLLHETLHVLSDDLCLGMTEEAVQALGVALADTLTRNGIVKL